MRWARSENNSDGGPVEVSASILEGKGPAGLYLKKPAEGKKDRKAGEGGNELVISEPNSLVVMGARLHHREAADKRTATAGFCSLPRSIAEPFRRS